MSCTFKHSLSCDNFERSTLRIGNPEFHKSTQSHSVKPLSNRSQSKKTSIGNSVSKYISTSDKVMIAVRKLSFQKLKRLRRGKNLNRVNFNVKELIKILSEEGIIEKGSQIFTGEEIDARQFEMETKEQRIIELENMPVEINKDSKNYNDLCATISVLRVEDEKNAELQGLASEIKEKNYKIAELEKSIKDLKLENENIKSNYEELYKKKLKTLESDIEFKDQKIKELNSINENHIKSIEDFKKLMEESNLQVSSLQNYCSVLSVENDKLTYQNRYSIQGLLRFNDFSLADQYDYIKENWSFIPNYDYKVYCHISNDAKYLFICISYIGKCKQMVTFNKPVSFIVDSNIIKSS